MAHTADAFAPRVVDPDLRAHVALRIDVDPRDEASLCEELVDARRVVETLVVEGDEQPGRAERREQVLESGRRLAA
jgi:hypothetical protein